MDEINRLIREFIHECGKMDIKTLEEFRVTFAQVVNGQQGTDIGKFICRTVIDLVIEKKQEKLINSCCGIATK